MPASNKGKGSTQKKQEGFERYVKSTKNPSYNNYVDYCKSRSIPVYTRHGFAINLDKAGIRPAGEAKNINRAESIQNPSIPIENPAPSLPQNDNDSPFDIVTEHSQVSEEASSIAETFQTEESTGAPIGAPISGSQEAEKTTEAVESVIKEFQDKLDPETFAYLPMAGVNIIIKKFIDSENCVTQEEASHIKAHTVKLIEKYGESMTTEYATELNFVVAMTNPIFRSALEKAEKKQKEISEKTADKQIDESN